MSKALRKNDIQVLSELEHVLKRAPMYVGSVAEENINTYIYTESSIQQKPLLQIPGLLKIFDEVLSNSVDEAIRTNFNYATKIKVTYDHTSGYITVEDNGRGLPVEYDEDTKKWTPEVIFTQLRAGSNFNDDEKGNVAGMNGVGASLTAIFSKFFDIETANGHKHYHQLIENHLSICHKPKIKSSTDNYTIIKFLPNYDYFKISDEAKDNLPILFEKRLKDLAFAYPEITFYFQKERISAANLKSFLKQIHPIFECSESETVRLGLFYSDTEFQQISFVNGCNTSRGGTHIEYISFKIIEHVREYIRKKHKLEVKPIDIRSKLFLLVSLRMQAPSFDSQTKERLISPNGFKSDVDKILTKKFLDSIIKNEEIMLPIVEAYKLQQQVKENVKLKQMSKGKKLKVDNYFESIGARKYFMICEGLSAVGGLMASLGRSQFSFFPIKGKPLNALEITNSKITENDEFRNMVNLLGIVYGESIADMTHEHIVISSDNDLDGNHIGALLTTFFYRFAPDVLKNKRLKKLSLPLVIGKKKDDIKMFFNFDEYKAFEGKGWDFKYYKGLGSWRKEDLTLLFKKYSVDYFIKDLEFDSEAEHRIKNWMGKEGIHYRKEKVLSKIFDISTI